MTAPPTADDAGGIYVHFPYCVHHCHYCDFNVVTPKRIRHTPYADAVVAELRARASLLSGPARSLYVGGGTPSLWEAASLGRVIAAARETPGLLEGAEITVEANPAQVDDAWVAAMRGLGVTRVSLGLQALRDDLLQALSRRHSAADGLAALARIANGGFTSFTADLIFGVTGQTLADWREDVARAADLGVPHLSVYNLTVEPRTVLAANVRRGRVRLPDDAVQADMLFAARELLTDAGYLHYEVSSYARPGHMAVHNAGYWEMRPYLGLGAGAHGFDGRRRWTNLHRVTPYIDAALAGDPSAEVEQADATGRAFERVMTGLRRLDRGVDLGADWPLFAEAVTSEARAGRLAVDGARIRLTELGLRYMDDVLVSLLPATP